MTTVHDDAIASARAAEEADFWRDLMPTATELVIAAGHASTRMLHRKMRIGWNLADQLAFELHEAGVVGPADEDGARQVLVEPGGLADVLAELASLAGEDPPAGEDTHQADDRAATWEEYEAAHDRPPLPSPPACLVEARQQAASEPGDTPAGEDGNPPDDEPGEPGGELATHPTDGRAGHHQPPALAPARPPRRRAAASWVRWHAIELVAVAAPGTAAVAVSPWWAAIAAAAGAWWLREEIRSRQALAGPPSQAPDRRGPP